MPNRIGAVTAPIIFGKVHFLLISENEFTHDIKCNGITSFTEFMNTMLHLEAEQFHEIGWLSILVAGQAGFTCLNWLRKMFWLLMA